MEARLGIVMGQQLGLRLADARESAPPRPGQCADGTAAGCSQQRLIGRVLDQGVLEEIRRLRRQPLLIQELRLHQLLQPRRKVASSQGETACSSS